MPELAVCDVRTPFSPFQWEAPPQTIVPIGSVPGSVANTAVEARELNLCFEQLVTELQGPYYHPVHDAFRFHPLHTHSLSKHQADVLRHGMVLDRTSGLVLVAVPRQCGDSGYLTAQGFESIHQKALNDRDAMVHPLYEEHTFVVYQLREDTMAKNGVKATALFRLVFRNEAYLNNASSEQSEHFPVYVLRAVYVSHSFYGIHQNIVQHRRYHSSPVDSNGNATADPRLLVELNRPELLELCDQWVQVLEGIVPSRYVEEDVARQANFSPSPLSSPKRRPVSSRGTEPSSPSRVVLGADRTQFPPLMFPLRCSYVASKERMEKRVSVVARNKDLVKLWREGGMDLTYFAQEVFEAEPERRVAECTRVLFRETKSGRNHIEERELVAFMPPQSDVDALQGYDVLPAERLRLWVFRALLTAELNSCHVLMLEMDTGLFLSQCVGLLGDSETNRERDALFHVCKIVLETVEDFVQHSGQIWQVTIAVVDAAYLSSVTNGAMDVVALCQDILECIMLSKHRIERTLMTPKSNEEIEDEQRLAEQREEMRKNVREMVRFNPDSPKKSASEIAHDATISENVIFQASTYRVVLTDKQLYPLFQYCDVNKNGLLSVRELTKLFLCKENQIARKNERASGNYNSPISDAEALRSQTANLFFHPLCPLDGCGLPFDEASIYQFVRSFCKHQKAGSRAEPELNYLEFSMMMLALAKR